MKDGDEDLFKPLSAKTGRKQYASGGREKVAQRGGEGRKWQQFLQRRAKDQARQAKGGAS
jgi:hypothetical protein